MARRIVPLHISPASPRGSPRPFGGVRSPASGSTTREISAYVNKLKLNPAEKAELLNAVHMIIADIRGARSSVAPGTGDVVAVFTEDFRLKKQEAFDLTDLLLRHVKAENAKRLQKRLPHLALQSSELREMRVLDFSPVFSKSKSRSPRKRRKSKSPRKKRKSKSSVRKRSPKAGTVAALRKQCKKRGIKGYSKLTKATLVRRCGGASPAQGGVGAYTLAALKKKATAKKIPGRSKMSKQKLYQALFG